MIDESSFRDAAALLLVKRAIRELMMDFPLGGLSLMGEAVRVVEDASIGTMCTDGRMVYVAPNWVLKNASFGTKFDLLHEWLHIFFNHVARKGDRDGKVWNEACDMVVVRECCTIFTRNGIVVTPPADGVQPADWAKDMTAEQIYDQLVLNSSLRPRPKGGGETQSASDFIYTPHPQATEDQFKRQFTEELAQAAMIQQQVKGKSVEEVYGDIIGNRLGNVLRTRVPWSRLLRGDLISDIGAGFPSYTRPNRKHYPDIILPTRRSRTEKKLFIGIDVSGSVSQSLFQEFKSNVLPAALRAKSVVVATFDAAVREVVRTSKPREVLNQVKFLTGAHSYTSTRDLFNLIEKENPSALTIFTDGFIAIPQKPFPKTLWVIPQNGQPQPWGRNYIMEVSW